MYDYGDHVKFLYVKKQNYNTTTARNCHSNGKTARAEKIYVLLKKSLGFTFLVFCGLF